MPVVADYKVIDDGKSTLKCPHGTKSYEFSLPGLVKSSPGILMFVCIATGNTGAMGNIAFEMHVNGTNQLTYGFGAFETMTLHEVIPASSLNLSPNQLFVKVLAGDGQLQIGDVVLWYHRNI